MTSATVPVPPELVRAAARDDQTALATLIRHAHPLVHRWALVQLGDPAEADDLTQNVLIRMMNKLHTFRSDSSFETWLYAMTRNAARDSFRRRRRTRDRTAEVPDLRLVVDPGPDPERATEISELRTALSSAFRQLPPRQREAFDLVELQGKSAADAAEILGVQAVSVRAHLFKARRALRKLVLEHHPQAVSDAP